MSILIHRNCVVYIDLFPREAHAVDYPRTRLDKYGFPRGYLTRSKQVKGFQTGDLVCAEVPASSKKVGIYIGRAAVRASGSFNIQATDGVIQGISYKYCRLIQRNDGYGYFLNSALNTGREQVTAQATTAAQSALYLPARNGEVSCAHG